jgi:hypothetical protein
MSKCLPLLPLRTDIASYDQGFKSLLGTEATGAVLRGIEKNVILNPSWRLSSCGTIDCMFAGGDASLGHATYQVVPVVEQTLGSYFATYEQPGIIFELASSTKPCNNVRKINVGKITSPLVGEVAPSVRHPTR